MRAKLIEPKIDDPQYIKQVEDNLWRKCSTLCSGNGWSYTSYSKKLFILVLLLIIFSLYLYIAISIQSTPQQYQINEIESKSIKFLINK